MKLRILSDLHIDINEKSPLELKDKDTFTIICGDTSGDPELSTKWIKENVNHGVFVSGNHLVYNYRGKDINELREMMYEADTGDCTYLDCMVPGCPIYRELDEKTVIIGSTMYTDFSLGAVRPSGVISETTITRNKYLSERCMNDYHWGRVNTDSTGLKKRHLNANDLSEAYKNFFGKLQTAVEDAFKDKDIIVVTHYCPSVKCISASYLDDDNNASYIVPLDDFIKKHPNIKLWCCGHVHHQDSFKIGSCRLVMNPRGYTPHCEDVKFDSRLYVDTETWEVHKHKKTKAEAEEYEKRFEAFKRYSAWFL